MDTKMLPYHLPKHLLVETGLPEGLIDLIFEYHGTIAKRFDKLLCDKMEQVRPFTKYMTEYHYNLKLWNVQRDDRFTYTDYTWEVQIKKTCLTILLITGWKLYIYAQTEPLLCFQKKDGVKSPENIQVP